MANNTAVALGVFRKRWFEGWMRGDAESYRSAKTHIWKRHYNTVRRLIAALCDDGDLAHDLVSDAFLEMMEELDCKLSGGLFLAEPDARGCRRGRVSGRLLHDRKPVEWRGADSFSALARLIWIRRAVGALKRHHRRHKPLVAILPDDAESLRGGIPENGLPSGPTPENLLLLVERFAVQQRKNASWLLGFVKDLAHASEELRDKPASREVVESTLIYVKTLIARRNPVWAGRPLSHVRLVPVEKLMDGANLADLDRLDGAEWRAFLVGLWTEQAKARPGTAAAKRVRDRLDQRVKRAKQHPKLGRVMQGLLDERGSSASSDVA